MASIFGFGNDRSYGESPEELRKKKSLAKVKKVILSSHEPLTPFVCRILFACMIGISAVDLISETLLFATGRQKIDFKTFLLRISWSPLMIWGLFGGLLILISIVQLVRNARYGYEERVYRFKDELEPGERLSDFDLVKIPESDMDKEALTLYSKVVPGKTRDRYMRYLRISGAGLLLFALLSLVLKFLCG